MNEMITEARQILGTYFRETGGEWPKPPQFALASDEYRAIDPSCRACSALALAAGLGFPVGTPLRSVSTPNLQLFANKPGSNKTIHMNNRYSLSVG